MSMRGIIRIAVQLDTFRNIDLYKQGLYQLRIQVYHKSSDDSRTYYAFPFSMLRGDKETTTGKSKSVDYHNIQPGRIVDESYVYCSRIFMVRYAEESIELQDYCQFLTEFDMVPGQTYYPCYMDVELYFAEMAANGPTEMLSSENLETELTKVSQQTVRILNPHRALFNYIPVTFDEQHYGVVNVVIHSAVMDFKFKPLHLYESDKEDVIMIAQKAKTKKRSAAAAPLPGSPREIFFPKVPAEGQVDPKQLERAYEDFIDPLAKLHESLKVRITKIRRDFPLETAILGPIVFNVRERFDNPP